MVDRQLASDLINAGGHLGQMGRQSDIADMLGKLVEANKGVVECPWCGGQIPKRGVEVCTHCAREIAWVDSPSNPNLFICCKPDPLEIEGWALAIARYELELREAKEADEAASKKRREREAKLFRFVTKVVGLVGVLIIPFFLFNLWRTELKKNNQQDTQVAVAVESKVKQQKVIQKAVTNPNEIENSIGVALKLIPAGTFTMGPNKWDWDGFETSAEHKVTITKPFYLGVTGITNAQWFAVMGYERSRSEEDDHPVERVRWDEAVGFCKNLSSRPEEQNARRIYRLPTEAEWEYACRAGADSSKSFSMHTPSTTGPVKQQPANPWGIFDMTENVLEWCHDRIITKYSKEPLTDPQGPTYATADSTGRIYRGVGALTRSDSRSSVSREEMLGFRIAMTIREVDQEIRNEDNSTDDSVSQARKDLATALVTGDESPLEQEAEQKTSQATPEK